MLCAELVCSLRSLPARRTSLDVRESFSNAVGPPHRKAYYAGGLALGRRV